MLTFFRVSFPLVAVGSDSCELSLSRFVFFADGYEEEC